MRTKWKILSALAVAAVVLWASLRPPPEPLHESKRLREWLDEGLRLVPSPYCRTGEFAHVTRALRAIGTNAIPILLEDLETPEPARWVERLKDRAIGAGVLSPSQRHSWRMRRTLWGFQALGTNLAPALPRLLKLSDEYCNETSMKPKGMYASQGLSCIGPAAVPDLERRLSSTDWRIRYRSADALASIGPEAEPAIPSLIRTLKDTNDSVRGSVALALARIDRQPERLVPVFRQLLSDSNDTARLNAPYALQRFGPAAKSAVPELLRALNDPDPTLSIMARNALTVIDPEALEDAQAPTNKPSRDGR